MCKKILLALVAVVTLIHHSNAQCLGGCCSAPNICASTQPTGIPNKGEWIIGVNLLTMQYKPLSDAELLQWSQPDVPVYSINSQWTAKASITVGISNRFSASVFLPYNYSTENREGHYHINDVVEIHTYGSIRGLGDGSAMVNYQFLDKDDKGWKGFAGVGLKVPTGKTDAQSTYDVVLPIHLQPGTGSWDPVAQVAAVKTLNRWTFQSQLFARIATTALEHNMGDYFRLDANASYSLLPVPKKIISSLRIMGGLEADHNSMMKMPANHIHDGMSPPASDSSSAMIPFANSGFTRLLAQGVLSCTVAKHVIIPLQFTIPVLQDLGGHQASLQWSASLGLNYSF